MIKKIHFAFILITQFTIITCLSFLCSCSSDNPLETDTMDKEQILYRQVREKTKHRINQLKYDLLNYTQLSLRSNDLSSTSLLYLLQTASNSPDLQGRFDDDIYEKMVEQNDKAEHEIYRFLEQRTSSKDLSLCLNFIASYDHEDCILIPQVNTQLKDNLLRQFAIIMIAIEDEIENNFIVEPSTRGYNSDLPYAHCLKQLKKEMVASMATGIIADGVVDVLAVLPGVDVVAALLDAGYDFYSAIEMANEFNKCLY